MAGDGEHHQMSEPLLDGVADMEEIRSLKQFVREAAVENKKLWYLAGPAIFTSLAQYSLDAVTMVFAGKYLTTVDLDAVSTTNLVIGGLSYGLMMGMGSALETLCGQAFGAKQLHMLGIYMQRSWVIITVTCICLLPIYILATPILQLFKQDKDIAVLSGRFSLYMIPQLFAYGFNFTVQKFLQAQGKVWTMAYISAAALVFHVFLSWLLILKFSLGLLGAAVSLNVAWWIVVLGQFAYITMGYCPDAWNGFSWEAFRNLGAFTRLSIASAIMICLEFWFFTCLIVLVGHLANAQVVVAAVSICTNIHGWEVMVFLGFNAAISVRISNELGAGRPRAARFSILVVIFCSVFAGLIFFTLVLILRNVYAYPFTNSPDVRRAVADLVVVFAFTLLFNSVQPVLSGVAVGAGWQALVAYVNLGCYYVVGIPLGYLMAYHFNLGVKGMWSGMLIGVGLQTLILTGLTARTNWNKEAMAVDSRIKKWGGSVGNSAIGYERT